MQVEVRAIVPEEAAAFARAEGRGFGFHPSDDDVRRLQRYLGVRRSFAAFVDGAVIGTASALPLEIVVPGGATLPMSGVSDVTVQPTHRRRGALSAMMRHHLEQSRERGEALAGLWASESAIYGRFGYGSAVQDAHVTVARAHGAFRDAPPAAGRIRFVDAAEAAASWPAVHRAAGAGRPGYVQRIAAQWEGFFEPEPGDRDAPKPFLVTYDEDGEPRGYAAYRFRQKWEQGHALSTVEVRELSATSDAARAALWRFLLDLDLVATIDAEHIALDDPLRWLLADFRRAAWVVRDALWVRIVDPERALAARSYATADALVLDIADETAPWAAGRLRVEAEPGGADVRRSDAPADLALGADALAAAYLGGVRLSTLAAAGRVEERTAGALARGDAMFRAERDPWCAVYF